MVQFVPEDISYGKISIKFDVWDIERLYQSIFSGTAVERQLVIKLKKKYAAPLHLIKVNGSNDIYDCYIGVISGELLARIYKDEGQELIQRMFVRFCKQLARSIRVLKCPWQVVPKCLWHITTVFLQLQIVLLLTKQAAMTI